MPDKTAIEVQVEQEKKELDAVPKQPIYKFAGGHRRCHLCGRITNTEDMKVFDTFIRGGTQRWACRLCNPLRGIK